MTDAMDDRDADATDNDIFYFAPRGDEPIEINTTWILVPRNVAYGKPEQLKERKASHTRNMRPLEVTLFAELYGNAKQWEQFRSRCKTLDEQHQKLDAEASVFERVASIAKRTRKPRAIVLIALGYEGLDEGA